MKKFATLLLLLSVLLVISSCSLVDRLKGKSCEHNWEDVFAEPTCAEKGYSGRRCRHCGVVEKDSETDALGHIFIDFYNIDDEYHWHKCVVCDAIKDKEKHTLDEDGICQNCDLPITPSKRVTYILSEDGSYAYVNDISKYIDKIRIAEEYNGVPVLDIKPGALTHIKKTAKTVIVPEILWDKVNFYEFSALETVIIPENVTTIKFNCFAHCTSLERIVIPDSVTTIENGAFLGCNKLSQVVFGKGVKSIGGSFNNLENIEYNDYEGGKYLSSGHNKYFAFIKPENKDAETVVFHPDTKIIAGDAFARMKKLTSVSLPDGVITVGERSFKSCQNLVSIDFGNSLETIRYSAFQECDALKYIFMPDTLTTLESRAFYGCSNLLRVELNPGLKVIEKSAFQYCSSLRSIELNYGLEVIEEYAFGNTDIEKIEIPDSIKSINPHVFSGCVNLKTVTLNEGTEEILDSAFSGCEKLSSINLPESLKTIGNGAFENCKYLESFVIPENVKMIGDYAFKNCYRLSSLALGNGITEIGKEAFYNCKIVDLVIPDSVKYIGAGAFEECDCLESIVLPKNLEVIAENLFKGCKALKKVEMPDYVTRIDSSAFYYPEAFEYTEYEGCMYMSLYGNPYFALVSAIEKQESYEIHKDTKIIASAAFYQIDTLTSIEIPGSVISICNKAFAECKNLESVTLNEGLEYIGDQAFSYCIFESIVLPDSLITIEGGFIECSNLSSITWGSGLKYIIGGFAECSSLTSIVIPEGVKEIRGEAFARSAISSVVLPESLEIIERGAFVMCENFGMIVVGKGLTHLEAEVFDAFLGYPNKIYFTGTKEEWYEIIDDPSVVEKLMHYNDQRES